MESSKREFEFLLALIQMINLEQSAVNRIHTITLCVVWFKRWMKSFIEKYQLKSVISQSWHIHNTHKIADGQKSFADFFSLCRISFLIHENVCVRVCACVFSVFPVFSLSLLPRVCSMIGRYFLFSDSRLSNKKRFIYIWSNKAKNSTIFYALSKKERKKAVIVVIVIIIAIVASGPGEFSICFSCSFVHSYHILYGTFMFQKSTRVQEPFTRWYFTSNDETNAMR